MDNVEKVKTFLESFHYSDPYFHQILTYKKIKESLSKHNIDFPIPSNTKWANEFQRDHVVHHLVKEIKLTTLKKERLIAQKQSFLEQALNCV